MSTYLHNFSHLRPDYEFNQEDGLRWLAKAHQIPYEKVERVACSKEHIEKRGYSVPEILQESEDLFGKGFGARNRFFEKKALEIFEKFYEDETEPYDLIHVTCTGYVSPSPAQRVVASKGWKSRVMHAYHMGCFASVPAIRMARGFASERVDIVHTEICSLHFNPHLHDDDQLVSQSLFADGFIKYSVSNQKKGFQLLQIEEQILPDTADQMTWKCEDWGLRMTLSREVPYHLHKVIKSFVERFETPDYFAIHPGGPKIIDRIQRKLQLSDDQVRHSRKILRQYGNMSSGTLPHIFEEMEMDLKSGDRVLGLAFGPGLMIVGVLLEKV